MYVSTPPDLMYYVFTYFFWVVHRSKLNIHKFCLNRGPQISCLHRSLLLGLFIISLEYLVLCLPGLLRFRACLLFLESKSDFLDVLEATNNTM
uniref:Uncharacterized protein n=1 Tax=Aegilops tauschii subsp. strangulata TaxID=200361 RepID=A0A453AQR6_AEGTS